MPVDSTLMAYAGYLAASACAMVIAAVLGGFHRHYRRGYLRHWSASWWAFSLVLMTAAPALRLSRLEPAPPATQLALAAVALTAAFWQAVWLLLGAYEVATGREVAKRRARRLWAGMGALVLGALAVSTLLPPGQRVLCLVGLAGLSTALAFGGAALGVLRSGPRPPGFGRLLLGASFLLYAAEQGHNSTILGVAAAAGRSFSYPLLLVPLDALLVALMGIGIVGWLLEEERSRAFDASAQTARLAYHDTVTELANRDLFYENMRISLGRAAAGSGVGVFLIDLDRFKSINESLGHRRGDELLKLVAERLRCSLRPGDTVGRLGSDEFSVLLPDVGNERELERLAEKALEGLRQPFNLDGREIVVSASLGISRAPADGSDAEELLRKAGVALEEAKKQGRDACQIYRAARDAQALDRMALENDLRRALGNDELLLYYQPVLEALTGRIEGVEALLRWQHPVRGLLLPADFLWLAEASGLSHKLDLWALRRACRQGRAWHDQGADWLRVAVNLSARSFQRPDLVDRVKETLWESGLVSSSLELEITETLAMRNAVESMGTLLGLKELGLRLAIDDFGTGYSSLSYLRSFPIDTLKIDASFVRSLPARSSAEIAAAMIALAHSLGIRVVAEGVEQEAQWRMLRDLGCDEMQGYLFSLAMPAGDCGRLVLGGRRSLLPERAGDDDLVRSAG
ncbi:MAG TPA: bifunctional diguanylate cyclase/phosphodiesterase [Thermoanaerobaculia bacterium]|nr:bifunctional diguanylate cyclase/phosphodiesterase [Thermoanaerobaculia bacterium]